MSGDHISLQNRFTFLSLKDNNTYELIAEYSYEYSEDYGSFLYIFNIFELGRENEDTFSLILREMENGIDLKVVDLYPDRKKYYLGKGISISIILKCRDVFKKRIISSNNFEDSSYGQNNTEMAKDKVWNRLVEIGAANYISQTDTYVVK